MCDCETLSLPHLRLVDMKVHTPLSSFLIAVICPALPRAQEQGFASESPPWVYFGFDAVQKKKPKPNPPQTPRVVPGLCMPCPGNFARWSNFLAPSGTSLVNKAMRDKRLQTTAWEIYSEEGRREIFFLSGERRR